MTPLIVPASRKRVITVRYKTPSREPIKFVVNQLQDAMGNWLMPTILMHKGGHAEIIESAAYAADLGKAYIVAAYFADLYAAAVKEAEFREAGLDEEEAEIEISDAEEGDDTHEHL